MAPRATNRRSRPARRAENARSRSGPVDRRVALRHGGHAASRRSSRGRSPPATARAPATRPARSSPDARSAGPGEPPSRSVKVVGESRSTAWTPGSVGQLVRSGGAPLKVAVTSVTRSRRRSARPATSTSRPARRMPTRSHTASTSRQVVRAQEHGLTTVHRLAQTGPELLLHQRIQAAGRLIEHQQPGPGGESGDQGDLLPVTGRVRAAPAVDLQVEPLDQLSLVGAVRTNRAKVAEQSQGLRAGQIRPQRDIGRDIGQVPVRSHRVGGIDAEDQRLTGRRPKKPEEQTESWSTCPHRSVRGNRTPRPDRTSRSRRSTAVVTPKRLVRPSVRTAAGDSAPMGKSSTRRHNSIADQASRHSTSHVSPVGLGTPGDPAEGQH